MSTRALALSAVWLLSAGTIAGQAAPASLHGTIAYDNRTTVPLDSVIVIRLVDASSAGTPGKSLAEVNLSPAGKQPPLAFELAYNPAEVEVSHNYEVRATLVSNGAVLLSSRPARVLTHGAPSTVAITLMGTQNVTAGAASIPLAGTRWKLVLLGDAAPKDDSAVPRIILEKGNNFTASTGCNELRGTYTLSQQQVQFRPLGTTTLVCRPAITQQERTFASALQATRSYRIQGSQLQLLLGNEALLTFQAEGR